MGGILKDKKGIIEQVKNPLKFFALALTIIEVVIGIIAVKAEMGKTYRFLLVLLMILIFLIVISAVGLIVIKWPQNLYENIAETVKNTEQIKEFVDSKAFEDVVKNITLDKCKNYLEK